MFILELVVEFELRVGEVAVVIVDDLRGKLLEDLGFEATHDEGHDFEVEFLEDLFLGL